MPRTFGTIFSLVLGIAGAANADCASLYGIKIVAEDGTFLGEIASPYDSSSIFNKYGTHGSAYSADSIFNKYGTYGSPYSSASAFNDYTATPPMLITGGQVVGYLSTNPNLANSINPYALIAECSD